MQRQSAASAREYRAVAAEWIEISDRMAPWNKSLSAFAISRAAAAHAQAQVEEARSRTV